VSSTFTPQMISLRHQGVYGMLVVPPQGTVTIVSGNEGSFQLSNGGLIGYAACGPVTVYTSNDTLFFNQSLGASQLERQVKTAAWGGRKAARIFPHCNTANSPDSPTQNTADKNCTNM
jgi:hypothetical protein